jgi:lysophospholipase L1-like esterase
MKFKFFLAFFVFAVLTPLLILFIIENFVPAQTGEALIYSPHSQAFYHSCEFDFSAKINSIGIRDHEIIPKAKSELRIVAIGDSYTYGWGIGIDSTWVKLSESALQKKGLHLKILNLGQGGTFSNDYVHTAQKAMELLQPDIVLIAFLQGDDLWSASLNQKSGDFNKGENHSFYKIVANMLEKLFPNILSHIKQKKRNISIDEYWKKEAKALADSFNEKEKLKFNSLNNVIKQCFDSGQLSPSVIYTSIKEPGCFNSLEDTASLFVQSGKQQILNDILKIKELSSQHNCQLLTLLIPDRIYVSKKDNEILKNELKLDVDTGLLYSEKVNLLYKDIMKKASIPFFDCNKIFIEHSESDTLYYPYDGHLTFNGNKLISEQFTLDLEKFISIK